MLSQLRLKILVKASILRVAATHKRSLEFLPDLFHHQGSLYVFYIKRN